MPWDWIILIGFLAFLAYVAWKIKREPMEFEESLLKYQLNTFTIPHPTWWSILKVDKKLVSFHRADTRYDWKASFTILPAETNLAEQIKKLMNDLGALFDEQEFIEQSNSDQFVRIEGTATLKGTQRAYLDAALIRQDTQVLYCLSHSSILNGLVEGPYFEKVIEKIRDQIASTKSKSL